MNTLNVYIGLCTIQIGRIYSYVLSVNVLFTTGNSILCPLSCCSFSYDSNKRLYAGVQKEEAADKKHEAGVTPKDVDFARWYADVIIKGELLSYYNISGLFVLRPSAYGMWEIIQKWFDERIKSVGVENCMFPLFIREDVLKKEEDHIEVRAVICCAVLLLYLLHYPVLLSRKAAFVMVGLCIHGVLVPSTTCDGCEN